MIEIRDFATLNDRQRREAAGVLMRALAHVPSAYHSDEEASGEVAKVADPDRLGFAALEDGHVLGWVGAIRTYDNGWALPPLVVDPARHRRGSGTRLVRALEDRARSEGVAALYLGTDDDFGGTNLFGADLFPDPLAKLAQIAPAAGHPFTFYLRAGFVVTGVLPDVNGLGKPDIVMAKRIEP